MKKLAILASGTAMLVLAAPADAALLQFTISGADTLSGINPPPTFFASFQLDSSPVINPINVAPGAAFAIANVAGTFRYAATTRTTPQPINFFSTSQRGGLVVGSDFFLAFDGPQLYTGTEAAPTFRTGNFTLTTLTGGSPIALTIAEVAAIPEPATWGMMLLGFGVVGAGMRARRRSTVTYA